MSPETRLEQLGSTVTDLAQLVRLCHYRDRTSILDITRICRYILLTMPSGHGKTTTLSTISRFYDILHKNEFDDVFFDFTEIGVRIELDDEEWEHNHRCVLNLDFGLMTPKVHREDFDFNEEVNVALKDFVDRYRSSTYGSEWGAGMDFVNKESAVWTLRNIL
ncbi:hypothetical protein V5O48_019333, partial [Marasmius crinis-equi]